MIKGKVKMKEYLIEYYVGEKHGCVLSRAYIQGENAKDAVSRFKALEKGNEYLAIRDVYELCDHKDWE
jgi:hypothetical protein